MPNTCWYCGIEVYSSIPACTTHLAEVTQEYEDLIKEVADTESDFEWGGLQLGDPDIRKAHYKRSRLYKENNSDIVPSDGRELVNQNI